MALAASVAALATMLVGGTFAGRSLLDRRATDKDKKETTATAVLTPPPTSAVTPPPAAPRRRPRRRRARCTRRWS